MARDSREQSNLTLMKKQRPVNRAITNYWQLAQTMTPAMTRFTESHAGPMTARLEGTPPKLYLVVDGTPWRVHDADYRDFKVLRRQLGDPAAQSRYFVAEDGTRRVYQFKKQNPDHGLELTTLTKQLSSAGWVGRERFTPGSVTPT